MSKFYKLAIKNTLDQIDELDIKNLNYKKKLKQKKLHILD